MRMRSTGSTDRQSVAGDDSQAELLDGIARALVGLAKDSPRVRGSSSTSAKVAGHPVAIPWISMAM